MGKVIRVGDTSKEVQNIIAKMDSGFIFNEITFPFKRLKCLKVFDYEEVMSPYRYTRDTTEVFEVYDLIIKVETTKKIQYTAKTFQMKVHGYEVLETTKEYYDKIHKKEKEAKRVEEYHKRERENKFKSSLVEKITKDDILDDEECTHILEELAIDVVSSLSYTGDKTEGSKGFKERHTMTYGVIFTLEGQLYRMEYTEDDSTRYFSKPYKAVKVTKTVIDYVKENAKS
jgi:hypothetical protein